MSMKMEHSRLLSVLAFIMLIAGCHDNPVDSLNPTVTNSLGNFEFTLTDTFDANAVLSYTWTNTEARAAIDHMSDRDDGTAIIRIKDGGNVEVYVSDLLESGTEESAIGIPGSWTITVTFDNFDGTAHFRVYSI